MSEKQAMEQTEDPRTSLTRGIMHILDSWGLSASQAVELLSLPDKTPTRMIRRYRENTPFPDNQEVNERLEHIVGIADALRTSWPLNPAMGLIWMKQKNKRFSRRSPIRVMVEDGLEGIISIRSHLDCSYDWFNS